jgi:predicted HTH domain antitoxin
MEIVLDLPESSFSALRTTPEEFAREMKHAAVAKWYEMGRISQAKGAEICGVTRAEFLRILGEHQVSVIQYDEAMLDRELS